ncbi:MAG: hypothetical protein GMKNLPBB_00861 [Myxococcota bacterium]|nr:hypothetical protein [Myxococcota bacterium]
MENPGMGASASDDALIARHKAAQSKNFWLRIAGVVVILLIITINVMSIINMVKADLLSPQGQAKLESHFIKEGGSLGPDLERELKVLVDNLTPVIQSTLDKQTKELGPKLEEALVTEIETVRKETEAHLTNELRKSLAALEAQQRATLIKAVPELANDVEAQNKVLEKAREAFMHWSVVQLADTVDEHVAAMEQIRKTLQSSYTRKEGAPGGADEVGMLWFELMNETLVGSDNILKGTEKNPVPAKEAGKAAPKAGK